MLHIQSLILSVVLSTFSGLLLPSTEDDDQAALDSSNIGTLLLNDYFLEFPADAADSKRLLRVFVDDCLVSHFLAGDGETRPKLRLLPGGYYIRVEIPDQGNFESEIQILGNSTTQWLFIQPNPTASSDEEDGLVTPAANVEATKLDPSVTTPSSPSDQVIDGPESSTESDDEDIKDGQDTHFPEMPMITYKNLGNDSNIREYGLGDDFIKIRFSSTDKIYIYTYRSHGKEVVDRMKELAESGEGLSTYIWNHVRKKK